MVKKKEKKLMNKKMILLLSNNFLEDIEKILLNAIKLINLICKMKKIKEILIECSIILKKIIYFLIKNCKKLLETAQILFKIS